MFSLLVGGFGLFERVGYCLGGFFVVWDFLNAFFGGGGGEFFVGFFFWFSLFVGFFGFFRFFCLFFFLI